jgi:hypothetical protein
MRLPGWKWIAGVGGALALTAGAGVWAARSPYVAEVVFGADVDRTVGLPRARRADRLEVPDPREIIARADYDELRRLGRPPVSAIWAARMVLPPPSEWVRQSSPPAPVDPTAPLAYTASAATTREPTDRDPFRVVDQGTGERHGLAIPIPPERPVLPEPEEEEEEEEAQAVPLPLPRPRDIPQQAQQQPAGRGAPVALVPPPTPPARPTTTPAAAAPATAPVAPPAIEARDGRVQVASLATQPTERRSPEVAPPVLSTPFGVPFALQHANVETSCFPPALVALLRRIEQRYGRRPVVTSGYRSGGRGGSLHRRCMAADIMVPGVAADDLARAARDIPGMGGVGIYCHQSLVHVDIGTPRDWRHGCGSFFAMRDGSVARGRLPEQLVNRFNRLVNRN